MVLDQNLDLGWGLLLNFLDESLPLYQKSVKRNSPLNSMNLIILRQTAVIVQNVTKGGKCVCLSAQSIVHGDVLSEKINFSAHGSSNSAKFGPDYLDP